MIQSQTVFIKFSSYIQRSKNFHCHTTEISGSHNLRKAMTNIGVPSTGQETLRNYFFLFLFLFQIPSIDHMLNIFLGSQVYPQSLPSRNHTPQDSSQSTPTCRFSPSPSSALVLSQGRQNSRCSRSSYPTCCCCCNSLFFGQELGSLQV